MKVAFGNTPPVTPASPVDIVVESTVTHVEAGKPVTEVVDVSPAAAIPTAPATAAVAVIPQAPVAAPAPRSDDPFAYQDDDIGFGDIILPRINIVQKVGDLSNIFTSGEIVLNSSLVIHTPANQERKVDGHPPLNLTVLGFRKRQFVEKTVGGKQGNLFNTEAEVVAAGGTLDFKEAQSAKKPLYQTLVTALVLIQKPEHIADEDRINFSEECEGKRYALALWSMKGTAFTNGAKVFFTARKTGHLKQAPGYPAQSWSFTTKLEKYSENFAHIPVLKPAAKNSPALVAHIRNLLCAGNS